MDEDFGLFLDCFYDVLFNFSSFFIKCEFLIFIIIIDMSEVLIRAIMDIFSISYAEKTISVISRCKHYGNFYDNEIF